MSFRDVSVSITASTAGFTAGMSRISASAKSTAAAVKGSFSDSSLGVSKTGALFDRVGTSIDKGFSGISKHKQSINTLSNGLLAVGITAGIGVGAAVKHFAEFDQAMSNVAATGQDARSNLDQLRSAAVKAGADTKFSATEAADGIEALSKAGVSAKDVLGGGLDGALNLAAAGNQSVADSAETAASAMNQFGLSGKDVPHIADLLAQAAGTAQGEVSDMAAALNQSGLVASQFGLSIDETTQALALFAKNGLIGSDAGTSFKTMLTSLYAPTGNAAAALKQLGISAYDSSGAIKDINPLADELKAKLDGLSEQDRNQALKNIFGSDAIRAGTILLKDGSKGLAQMATDFGKFGSAADVAKIKMNNLNGDLEQLQGSLDTAFIGAGSGGNNFLRSLAQGATRAANAFNSLSPAAQENALKITAFVAGAALAAGGLGKLVIAVGEVRGALVALNIVSASSSASMASIAGAAGPAAVALLAVAAAGAAFDQLDSANKTADELTASLQKIGAGSSDLSGLYSGGNWADSLRGSLTSTLPVADNLGTALAQLSEQTHGSQIQQWALGFERLKEGITPGTQGLEKMQQQVTGLDHALAQMVTGGNVKGANSAFSEIAKQAQAQGVSMSQLLELFPQYKAAAAAAADATSATGAAASGASGAIKDVGAAAGLSADDLAKMVDAAYALQNQMLQLSGSAIGVEAAIDAASKAAKDNGKTLNINTAKGRANQEALNSLAQATIGYTSSLVKAGASADEVNKANERGRGAWIKTAESMGKSRREAETLSASLFALPATVHPTIAVAGAELSKKQAREVNNGLKDIPKEKRAEIITIAQTKGAKAAKAAMEAVKDKTVIARSKGDLRGAQQVNAAMKALRDRLVKAISRGDKKGANDIRAAMAALRDRTVTAHTRADTSGARAAQAAMNAVHDRTATVTIRHNDIYIGGQKKGSANAAGGYITGPGTSTSDDIPAWLSNGEFVVRAAAVKAVGVDELYRINALGYATGGPVGPITSAIPAGVNFTTIWNMIVALTRPLAAVASANTALIKAQAARATADRAARTAKRGAARTAANEKLKTATDNLTDATKNLKDAQQAVADQARQMSQTLSEPFRSKSHDIDDWLDSMKQGAVDLKAFQGQIASLRKLGVSETIIQQITGQGALVGQELAGQILQGGKNLATALNTANGNLQRAADGLGYDVIQATGRYASGGFVSGPGSSMSDSINARLSNGEYVVNAKATALNRAALDAMNYGRKVGHQFSPGFALGGYVQPSHSKHIHGGDVTAIITSPDPDTIVRKIANSARDSLALAALGTI